MKVGASIAAFKIDEEIFKKFQEANIDYIEVSCGHLDTFEALDFEKIKSLSELYGVKLWSFHLSFFPFEKLDISSLNPKSEIHLLLYFQSK